MANNQQTRNLYRELRGASLSKDLGRSCLILRKIVEMDPEDAYAHEQLQAVGCTLCKEHVPELEAAISRQDAAEITRLVANFRGWADEAWLTANVPCFARAVSMGKSSRPKAATGGASQTGAPAASSAPAGGRSGSNPQTRELYRELRGALVSKDHEKSFSLICRILEIDPQDKDAQAQRQETGRWLCEAHAGEVAAVLATHDQSAIAETVARFRSWADDEYLLREVPSYQAAAKIADAVKKAALEQELRVKFGALGAQKDLESLHEVAVALERFAANNGIQMDEKQRAAIAAVQKRWKAAKLEEERKQIVEDAEETLAALMENYHLSSDKEEGITASLAEFQKLREELSGKEMFPELEAVYSRVCKCQEEARLRVRQLRQRKWLRRTGVAVGGWLLVALGGGAIYVYSTVDKETANLYAYISNKNSEGIRALLEESSLSLSGVYRKISSDYAAAYTRCQQWLAERDAKVAQFCGMLPRLAEVSGNMETEELLDAMDMYSTVLVTYQDLKDNFGCEPTPAQKADMAEFEDVIKMRFDAIISYFNELPESLDLDSLAVRNKRFAALRTAMDISNDVVKEHDRCVNRFVRRKLLCLKRNPWHMSAAEVEEGIRAYEKYAADLQLDASLRDELNKLRSQAGDYQNRAQKLIGCSSLAGFIRARESFSAYTSFLGNRVLDISSVKKISELLPDMAIRLALEGNREVSRLFGDADVDSCVKKLREVNDIFSDRSDDVYAGNYGRALRTVIDRVVPAGEKSSPLWPAKAYQLLGDKVYTLKKDSRISKINGQTFSYPLNSNGEDGEKANIPSGAKKVPLRLDTMRQSLGFVRDKLLQKQVTPVSLMERVARISDKGYPPMARAYLFGACVEMLDAYASSPASGLAFSSKLRLDVERYRNLAQIHPVKEGAWLAPHAPRKDEAWTQFFSQIAGHDYTQEILATIRPLLKAELEYVGYVGDDGETHLRRQVASVYYVDFSGSKPACKLLSHGRDCQAYTPLFALKKP